TLSPPGRSGSVTPARSARTGARTAGATTTRGRSGARRKADPSRDSDGPRELRVVLPPSPLLRQLVGGRLNLAVDVGHARDERVLSRGRVGPHVTEQLPGVLRGLRVDLGRLPRAVVDLDLHGAQRRPVVQQDFIARLAALVPKPRAHQIRYHGVFAPASPDRARVVPRTRAAVAGECGEASVTDRQRALALTWAQRLKRVFAIEIETCRRCGGRLRVIASIEAPTTIERILAHLSRDAEPVDPAYPGRAPPQGELSF